MHYRPQSSRLPLPLRKASFESTPSARTPTPTSTLSQSPPTKHLIRERVSHQLVRPDDFFRPSYPSASASAISRYTGRIFVAVGISCGLSSSWPGRSLEGVLVLLILLIWICMWTLSITEPRKPRSYPIAKRGLTLRGPSPPSRLTQNLPSVRGRCGIVTILSFLPIGFGGSASGFGRHYLSGSLDLRLCSRSVVEGTSRLLGRDIGFYGRGVFGQCEM